MMRLMVRGYLGRVLQFAIPEEIEERDLDTVVPRLAEGHAKATNAGFLSMIELEFLDEPDINQRFHRIGIDPSGMVMPLRVDLARKKPS